MNTMEVTRSSNNVLQTVTLLTFYFFFVSLGSYLFYFFSLFSSSPLTPLPIQTNNHNQLSLLLDAVQTYTSKFQLYNR
ncbi:hypothetical protein VNO77_06055 [Canavalia gladiata]|uniref:Uncharacterized protein n=1 Tax=Canavalia gladiata TaxID=3824 RepID=A0AAN9MZG6_CANGL